MDNQLVAEFMMDYNKHRECVAKCLSALANNIGYEKYSIEEITNLMSRAFKHDRSKEYNYEEFEGYVMMRQEFKGVEYNTDEHRRITAKYQYVIDLHYKNNDHHPQHFKNGVLDMNRMQLHEMVCDWVGAMMSRGGLDKFDSSFEYNKTKLNIPDDIYAELYGIGKWLVENVA